MNLVELLEARQKSADELSDIKVKKSQLEARVKSETLDEETLKQIQSDVDTLVKRADVLKEEIKTYTTSIEEKENQLSSAATELHKTKKGNSNMDYLKTKEAAIDFVKTLMDNQDSPDAFRKAWNEKLVEKGASNLDKILPEPVLLAIQDAFVDYHGILNHVTKDPRYAVRVALQTQVMMAKGQKVNKVKKDEDITFSDFTINSATIYIKYSFEYADLKKDTTGAYFNYVMKELAQGFIRAVERAIVIGDGRGGSTDDKITEIKSIAEETENNLFDTHEINVKDAAFTTVQLEALVGGLDKLAPNTNPIIITSKTIARKLKMAKDSEGRYLDPQPFAPISTSGNVISGFTVYVYEWMEDKATTTPIIAVADKSYTLIGDDVAADRIEDYDITLNRRHIELASVMGGRLSKYKSAVKFTAAS